MLLYVHRNRRLIRDGNPGRPPRLSHSSRALKGVALIDFCCLTSTEARRPVRDGGTSGKRGGGGQKSETSKQAPTRKTKAAVDRRQNNRMLRQCPSGIAQRPQHHAIAVPTAVLNRVTKTMSVAPPLGSKLKQKKSNSLSLYSPASPPCS